MRTFVDLGHAASNARLQILVALGLCIRQLCQLVQLLQSQLVTTELKLHDAQRKVASTVLGQQLVEHIELRRAAVSARK